MAISEKDIEHLKDLARVEFGGKETEKLAQDLGGILEYVGMLKEADISGAAETEHAPEGLENVFREDSAESRYGDTQSVIDAFPEQHKTEHGTFLKVQQIL